MTIPSSEELKNELIGTCEFCMREYKWELINEIERVFNSTESYTFIPISNELYCVRKKFPYIPESHIKIIDKEIEEEYLIPKGYEFCYKDEKRKLYPGIRPIKRKKCKCKCVKGEIWRKAKPEDAGRGWQCRFKMDNGADWLQYGPLLSYDNNIGFMVLPCHPYSFKAIRVKECEVRVQ